MNKCISRPMLLLVALSLGCQITVASEEITDFDNGERLKSELILIKEQQQILETKLAELKTQETTIKAAIKIHDAKIELSRIETEQTAIRNEQSRSLMAYLQWLGIATLSLVGIVGALLYRKVIMLRLKGALAIKMAEIHLNKEQPTTHNNSNFLSATAGDRNET